MVKRQKKEFLERVMELSGENLYSCYQCGKCSGGCPVSHFMDLVPRDIIYRVLDDSADVLDAETQWVCASCYTCTVRCPNDIDIAAIMEALRQLRLRAKYDHLSPSSLSEEDLEELPQIALISCFRKMTG